MAVEEIYFAELSKELAAQREARESLRTRAIAILSTGALVFALTRSQSSGHLDGWLLASLMVLVVMGFCVALVLAPAPITTVERYLNLEDIAASAEGKPQQDADRKLYRDLIYQAMEGLSSNRVWTNRSSLLYLTATVLLVVEIALIAAHFSDTSSYRVAVGAVTAIFLVTLATCVLPERMWILATRVPLLGGILVRRRFANSVLMAPLNSLRVPAPIPGVDLGSPPNAHEVEEAIQAGGDVVEVFQRSSVYALGKPAGEVIGITGTESDLLHFTADVDAREVTFLPVFTHARFMIEPLQKNPDWRTQSVLQIEGQALMDNVDDDVTIVINPGSDAEFQIPPTARASHKRPQARSGDVAKRRTARGTAKTSVGGTR